MPSLNVVSSSLVFAALFLCAYYFIVALVKRAAKTPPVPPGPMDYVFGDHYYAEGNEGCYDVIDYEGTRKIGDVEGRENAVRFVAILDARRKA